MITSKDLQGVELLQGINQQALEELAGLAEERQVNPGTLIITQGDQARCLFFLLNGKVQVVQTDGDGFEHQIATLNAGMVFGERALLMEDRRSADVLALEPVRLAVLAWEDGCRLMQRFPGLYANLCRHLALQLGNWTIRHQREEKEARELLTNLVGWQILPEFDSFPGISDWARQLNQQIRRLASNDRHVIIQGEAGTWKELAARLIHYCSGDQTRPILYLDCATPPPVLKRQERRKQQRDPLLTALVQESTLFGHAPDSGLYADGTRRGYLELAHGGELILENIEFLDLRVQQMLVDFLCSGVLFRRGEEQPRHCELRVIATSDNDLGQLVISGQFLPDLYPLLEEEKIQLLPLRQRQKDIPVIAKQLLVQLNRKHHKQVRGFSQEALNRLVDYRWPLNGQELQQVIDRAVSVCQGTQVLAEQIFLNITTESDSQRLNLLQLPLIRQLFLDKLYPNRLIWLTLPVMLLVLLGCLFGPASDNPLNLLLWSCWWPGLLLLVWVSGRSWCSICPLERLARFWPTAGRHREPLWLQRFGSLAALGGVGSLLWLEQQGDLFHRALGAGHLLLVLLLLATISQGLFGHRRWCKYLCPLGWLIGRAARYSLIKLRSNTNVCLSQCRIDDCIRHRECPMGLHPTAAESSDDCLVCGFCIRHCPHDAIRLDLRFPWQGVLDRSPQSLPDALLPPLLLAVVLAARGAEKLTPPPAWAGTFLGALLVLLGAFALVCHPWKCRGWGNRFARLGAASLPLALAALFGLFFRELLEQGPELPQMLRSWLRLQGWIPAGYQLDLGTLHILLPLLLLIGLCFSWYLLKRLAVGAGDPQGSLLSVRLLLLSLAALLLWVL